MTSDPVLVNLVGAVGFTISVTMFLPQTLRVLKVRHQPEQLLGVSVLAQRMIVLNAAVWILYAVLTQAWWSGAPGLVNIPLSLVTLHYLHRARALVPPAGRAHLVNPAKLCGWPDDSPHDFLVTTPPGYGTRFSPCSCNRSADGHAVPPLHQDITTQDRTE